MDINYKLNLILINFSITRTQLAKILRIERILLSQYTQGSIELPDNVLSRISLLYDIAINWSNRGVGALNELVLIPLNIRSCFLDYLREDVLDIKKIYETLDEFEKIKKAGDWRDGFRKLGFKDSTFEEQERNLQINLSRIEYEQ